jgi:Oxidoreductase molybdopterin binding domain/Mo-co oxidoreductase dimerisation domain
VVTRRPLVTGLSAGTLALGVDYLGHAVAGLPLLPEQAGYLLLKVLPLTAFESLLKTLGLLARPLLLLGATVVIIGLYGLAAALLGRWQPTSFVPVLTGLVGVVGAAIVWIARSPGDSWLALIAEIVVLAGAVPIVDLALNRLSSPAVVDEDRRILLRNLFYGAVGIAVVGIGYANVRRFMTALAAREGSRATTELTDVKNFYIVSKNLGGDPVVDGSSWRLRLPTRSLTYEELLALPAQTLELTLSCISNEVGGTLISNGLWKGPRVNDILALTTVPVDAVYMLMESADGYTESFPLRELTPDHLLATHLNGAALTPGHGYPARFLLPGHYGMKQPKWVTRISFSKADQPGYWENNGWDERAIVKTMSRIDQPADGTALPAGSVNFSGIAFAGARRISEVELSMDGGRSWRATELRPEFSPYSWRFWQLTTTMGSGHYQVSVRARDGQGTTQTAKATATLPNGADGYHSISLDLA